MCYVAACLSDMTKRILRMLFVLLKEPYFSPDVGFLLVSLFPVCLSIYAHWRKVQFLYYPRHSYRRPGDARSIYQTGLVEQEMRSDRGHTVKQSLLKCCGSQRVLFGLTQQRVRLLPDANSKKRES